MSIGPTPLQTVTVNNVDVPPNPVVATINGVAAGGLLVYQASFYRHGIANSVAPPNVVDSAGGARRAATPATKDDSGSSFGSCIWYVENAAAGTHVFSIDLTETGTPNAHITITEWPGALKYNALDNNAFANATTNSITAGPITPIRRTGLVIGGVTEVNTFGVDPQNIVTPSGYTSLHINQNGSTDLVMEHSYKILTLENNAPTAQSANWTWDPPTTDTSQAVLAVFTAEDGIEQAANGPGFVTGSPSSFTGQVATGAPEFVPGSPSGPGFVTGSAASFTGEGLTGAPDSSGNLFFVTMVATVSSAVSMLRQVNRVLTVSQSAASSLLKSIQKALSVSGSSSPQLVASKTTIKSMSASGSSSATVTKQVNKPISVSSASTPSIARQVGKVLTSTGPSTVSIIKRVGKTVSSSTASVATIISRVGKILSVAATSSVSVVKRVGKTLAASSASTATIAAIKLFTVTLTAASATTATIARRAGKLVVATVGISPVITKAVAKLLAATVATTATMTRAARKVLAASSAVVATLTAVAHFAGSIFSNVRFYLTDIFRIRSAVDERTRGLIDTKRIREIN